MRSPAARPSSDEDLVRIYLQEIGKRRLLTATEEVSLAKAIEAGTRAERRLLRRGASFSERTRRSLERQVAEGRAARHTFIEANLRLVVSNARRYQGFGLPLLDLIQDGNIGLLRAVEKFDWRRGFKFSTYATWWIRQGITRGLADRGRTIRLPVHVTDLINRLRRTESDLSSKFGRDPSDAEIAAALGVDVEHLATYRALASDTVSLSTPLGADGDSELHDHLADDNCEEPLEEAVRARSADELRAVLLSLSDREKRILELRFGLADGREKTLEAVGGEFGLTRERIRQIEAKAIAKLRHPSRWRTLQDFAD